MILGLEVEINHFTGQARLTFNLPLQSISIKIHLLPSMLFSYFDSEYQNS